MDKQYIEDNEIGIKYLRKQLNPDEVEAFEIYLMENPEMVDELELVQILNGSLGQSTESGSNFDENVYLGGLDIEGQPNRSGQVRLEERKQSRFWLASVIGAFFMGLLVSQLIPSLLGPEQFVTTAQIQYLSSERGAANRKISGVFRKTNKNLGAAFVFVLELGSLEGENYQVRIVPDEESAIYLGPELLSLVADQDGTVSLMLEEKQFSKGVFKVEAMSDRVNRYDSVFYVEVE